MKELRFVVIGLFAATALSFIAMTALALGHGGVADNDRPAGAEAQQ